MADISHRQVQLAQSVYVNMLNKLDPRDLVKLEADAQQNQSTFIPTILEFCAEFAFNACIAFEVELESITEHPLKSGTVDDPLWGETDVN